MARRRTPSATTKPPDYTVTLWPSHTYAEQLAITNLIAAFGTVTVITANSQRWVRPEGAKQDRCGECLTWWSPTYYPKCGFCGTRDAA